MITQLQAANETGLSDILKHLLTIELVGPEGEMAINENGDTQEFHVYKPQRAFESTHLSKTFHLHPEAVHEIADSTTRSIDKATVVCHKCNN